jgi:hypothetical protein
MNDYNLLTQRAMSSSTKSGLFGATGIDSASCDVYCL